MKPLRLTAHAAAMMTERGIPSAAVEATARTPLWAEPDPRDAMLQRRFRPVAAFGGRILRVVCCETEHELRIVTVMFDRNARRTR